MLKCVFLNLQDEDIYLSAIERDATASAVCTLKQSTGPISTARSNDSSDDENDTDEGTISGENDVEYAEFSLSVRTSPKEQIVNRNTNASDELNNLPRSHKSKRSTASIDAYQQPSANYMIMPMARERSEIAMPSNLPGKMLRLISNQSNESATNVCFQLHEIAIVRQWHRLAFWKHCSSHPNQTPTHRCWLKHFCPAAVHHPNPARRNRFGRLSPMRPATARQMLALHPLSEEKRSLGIGIHIRWLRLGPIARANQLPPARNTTTIWRESQTTITIALWTNWWVSSVWANVSVIGIAIWVVSVPTMWTMAMPIDRTSNSMHRCGQRPWL